MVKAEFNDDRPNAVTSASKGRADVDPMSGGFEEMDSFTFGSDDDALFAGLDVGEIDMDHSISEASIRSVAPPRQQQQRLAQQQQFQPHRQPVNANHAPAQGRAQAPAPTQQQRHQAIASTKPPSHGDSVGGSLQRSTSLSRQEQLAVMIEQERQSEQTSSGKIGPKDTVNQQQRKVPSLPQHQQAQKPIVPMNRGGTSGTSAAGGFRFPPGMVRKPL